MPTLRPLWLVLFLVSAAGCDDDSIWPWDLDDLECDGDADCAEDPNRDPTQDAGADADTGADADADADADNYIPTGFDERYDSNAEDGAGVGGALCGNGHDDDSDGLADCAELGCLIAPGCCVPAADSGVVGDFSTCTEGLDNCGWQSFNAGASSLELEGGILRFASGSDGETGIYSNPLLGLAGEPTLSFVASLDPATCALSGCDQVLGVALTQQESFSQGTGVTPTVGIVLDGESRAIHLYFGGRRGHTIELADNSSLLESRLYALRLHPMGEVSFWVDQDPLLLGSPSSLPEDVTFSSLADAGIGGTTVRVAAFANLRDGGQAQLAGLHLDRQICDVPDGWTDVSVRPVVTSEDDTLTRNPTVIEAGAQLVMIYETGSGLALASSVDGGSSWSDPTALFAQGTGTAYGNVDRRSPSALAWNDGNSEALYHLWFVGEAASSDEFPVGVSPTAILHAVSENGFDWQMSASPVAIETTRDNDWLAGVEGPTVAYDEKREELVMVFVGQRPFRGETGLLLARSDDGIEWHVSSEPIRFEHESSNFAFERDGRVEPELDIRDDALRLWYVGLDGARSTIGFAVSGTGAVWERYGPVLSATRSWESRRIGGVAAYVHSSSEEGLAQVSLWYTAGAPEREAIGWVTREVPQ